MLLLFCQYFGGLVFETQRAQTCVKDACDSIRITQYADLLPFASVLFVGDGIAT